MTTAATGEQILKDILAQPDRDDLRLIYADFLEEQGETERAEFIRVQCQIAEIQTNCLCWHCVKRRGGGQHHNGTCQLKRYAKSLLAGEELLTPALFWKWFGGGLERAWSGSPAVHFDATTAMIFYATRDTHPSWRLEIWRGFVEKIELPGDAWVEYEGVLLAHHPIREVRLTTLPKADSNGPDFWFTRRPQIHLPVSEGNRLLTQGRGWLAVLEHCWPGIRFSMVEGQS